MEPRCLGTSWKYIPISQPLEEGRPRDRSKDRERATWGHGVPPRTGVCSRSPCCREKPQATLSQSTRGCLIGCGPLLRVSRLEPSSGPLSDKAGFAQGVPLHP